MGKWQVGAQVVAIGGTILADGDEHDGIVGVGAGTLGVIVGVHGFARGLGGRFGRRLSVRIGGRVEHFVGTDEVRAIGGAYGDVTRDEAADAIVEDAWRQLRANLAGAEMVRYGVRPLNL